MTEARIERRLAAILAADIAGYSRLMGADEVGTLVALKAYRHEVVDPAIAAHHGRIVKTTGDGMLVEFASAVDAVTCAMAVQDRMAERNSDAAQKIAFRIGINIGDIIIDGDDIFGDGVNVAARIENECEPGRVYLSGSAFEQVRGKTSFGFNDLGEKSLKNIDRPVRLYGVQPTVASLAAGATPPDETGKPLALPDKPSIAVLPFQNMSGDPEQEYFADGMVEDIITGLSRSKSLFVIARHSSFTYKDKAVDIKQVGRELGVRYVLEGSVRKAGNRIRITGQLIDATTGVHIWADKFDSELEDIFDLQDRVTSDVIGAISPQLVRAEIERAQRKPTENLHAYDYYLRALFCLYRFTRETNIEAFGLAETASRIDPAFALSYAFGALTLVQRKAFGWSIDPAREAAEAMRLARKAIELETDDPSVLAMAGHALGYAAAEVEEGSAYLSRAIDLDPNMASARFWGGWSQIYLGNLDIAIERFQVALRLSPLDPRIFLAQTGMAFAYFLAGRYDEGLSWATLAVQRQPNYPGASRILMCCQAMSGRIEEARRTRALALQQEPTLRISGIKTTSPFRRTEDVERLAEAYRIADVPE